MWQPGGDGAGGLQVKEVAQRVAGRIAEGGGLDDGEVAGLSVAGAIAGVEAVGGDFHSGLVPFFDGSQPRRCGAV